MKRFYTLLALMCIAVCISAQVPQKIAYQAVLRNGDGSVIANENVVVKIGLLKGNAEGEVVYSEQHAVTTTAQGVISLAIGSSSQNVEGAFIDVPWNNEIYIKIEVKRSGSSDFVAMAPNRVLSVPYSLRAQAAANTDTARFANTAEATRSLVGAVELKPETTHNVNSPIFVVRNSAGQVVFAVYDEGLRSYIGNSEQTGGFVVEGQNGEGSGYFVVSQDSTRVYSNGTTKGPRSGFAVGGRAGQKSLGETYFAVSPYLTEIYFDTTMTKGPRSGFAVGGRAGQKGEAVNYLSVTPTMTEISFDSDNSKGPRSGFAVGGRAGQKSETSDYLSVTPLMTNVYFDASSKGPRSGFAVGGRSGQKNIESNLLSLTFDSTRIYFNDVNKGPRSGFAVGGRAGHKGVGNNYLDVTNGSTTIISNIPEDNSTGQPSNNVFHGFDVGGISSSNTTYTSFFSVTPTITVIPSTITTTGSVEITNDVVENYDPTDVQDGDKNWYKTVLLGNKRWIKSNLRTTKFSDGTAIPEGTYIQSDSLDNKVVGNYYKQMLIHEMDKNVCPVGYHISTLSDWESLRSYILEQGFEEAEILNSLAINGYWDENQNVTPLDTFGFSMPGAGLVNYDNELFDFGASASYWLGGFEQENAIYFSDSIGITSDYMNALTIRCVEGSLPLTVRTEYHDSLLTTSVILSGMILNEGATAIVERGFCYGLAENPDVSGIKVLSSDTTEYFSAKISGLEANTKYFARAYAINATDTSYGENYMFMTMPFDPIALIDSIGSIEMTKAIVYASILGVDIERSGIIFGTDSILSFDAAGSNLVENSYNSVQFPAYLGDLQPNTMYYVMAYLMTATDTVYSEIESFTTPKIPASVITKSVTFSTTSAVIVGATEGEPNTFTNVGVCYGFSPNPDFDDHVITLEGLIGEFIVDLDSLEELTTYNARVFGIGVADTIYSENVEFTTLEDTTIYKGDVILKSQEEIDQFIGHGYSTIQGNLLIGNLVKEEPESYITKIAVNDTIYYCVEQIEGDVDSISLNSVTGSIQIVGVQAPTISFIGAIADADTLVITHTPIEMLDVSSLSELRSLQCNSNALTNLYLNGCEKLTYLDCSGNSLTELDLESNVNLEYVNIGNNSISRFAPAANVEIQELICQGNSALSELMLSNQSNMVSLVADSCSLDKALIFPQNGILNRLSVKNTHLVNLALRGDSLREIDCSGSTIRNLIIEPGLPVRSLYCQNNLLPQLNIKNCGTITDLLCGNQRYMGGTPEELLDTTMVLFLNSDQEEQFNLKWGTLEQNTRVVTSVDSIYFGVTTVDSLTFEKANVTGLLIPLETSGVAVNASMKGFCYGTAENPTVEGDSVLAIQQLGLATAALTDLTPKTQYYVRPFAVISSDTLYGASVTFTTPEDPAIYEGDVILKSQEEIDQFIGHGYSTIRGNLLIGNLVKEEPESYITKINVDDTIYYCVEQIEGEVDSISLSSVTGSIQIVGVQAPTISFIGAISDAETLVITHTPIETLDVSSLPELRSLQCNSNALTNLYLNGCENLTYLDCSGNSLTELDLESNVNLEYVNIGSNSISRFAPEANVEIQELICQGNSALSELMLPNQSNMVSLVADSCSLDKAFRLPQNGILNRLSVKNTHLVSLTLRGDSLREVDCSGSTIRNLIIEPGLPVRSLYCQNNLLPQLNIKNCGTITDLLCGNQRYMGVNPEELLDTTMVLFLNSDQEEQFNLKWGTLEQNTRVVTSVDSIYFGVTTVDSLTFEKANVTGLLIPLETSGVAVNASMKGFCYGTAENPTVEGNSVSAIQQLGLATAALTDLTPLTQYYVRPFAVISSDTLYGATVTFTTLDGAPSVEMVNIENNNGKEIILNSKAFSKTEFSDYGFCISTTNEIPVLNGEDEVYSVFEPSVDSVKFSFTYNSFECLFKYYVVAFAINEYDTVYSAVSNFQPVSQPILRGATVDSITVSSAVISDSIVYDGGNPIIERGVNLYFNTNETRAVDSLNFVSDDTTDLFSVKLDNLMWNNSYTVKTYAINSLGRMFSETEFTTFDCPDVDFVKADTMSFTTTSINVRGYATYGNSEDSTFIEYGICYDTISNPDISGPHIVETDTCSSMSETITGLKINTPYYLRLYAITKAGICYSNESVYKTADFPAITGVEVIKNPESLTANISIHSYNGRLRIDSCGIEIISNGVVDSTVLGVTNDSGSITELEYQYSEADTVIYFKSFVATKVGLVYGDLDSIVINHNIKVRTLGFKDLSYTKVTVQGEVEYDMALVNWGVKYGRNRNELACSTSYYGSNDDGRYDDNLENLKFDSTYYFCYYVHNNDDQYYGDTLSFTMLGLGTSPADGSGNTYNTIIINGTEWFAENLKTKVYNDGTPIPELIDNDAWANDKKGAFSYSKNNSSQLFVDSLGLLYNWYAVHTGKLCPTGWVVPSYDDWNRLLNVHNNDLNLLVEKGTWPTGSFDTQGQIYDNTYRFSARQVTRREIDGAASAVNTPYSAYMWTSSYYYYYERPYYLLIRDVNDQSGKGLFDGEVQNSGLSVRCIKAKNPMLNMDSVIVGDTNATLYANLIIGDPDSIVEYGFLAEMGNSNPTYETADIRVVATMTDKGFYANITGLTPNVEYGVSAYVIDKDGNYWYGDHPEITTTYPPTRCWIDTLANKPAGSVSIKWNIFTYEKYGIDRVGLCMKENSDTTSLNMFDELFNSKNIPRSGELFSENIQLTLLKPETDYSLRIYVLENNDTIYSEQIKFTTESIKYGDDVQDLDGNIYKTLNIGTQKWFASNLRTTKFNDGFLINNGFSMDTSWTNTTQPAYCYYDNNVVNADTFGCLYNGYAISNDLCPAGWMVPTVEQYDTLFNYLIKNGYNFDGSTDENFLAKSLASKSSWITSIYPGTPGKKPELNNNTGYNLTPSGSKSDLANYTNVGNTGGYWTSTESGTDKLIQLNASYESNALSYDTLSFNWGQSVRCIKKDAPTVIVDSFVIDDETGKYIANCKLLDQGSSAVYEYGVYVYVSDNPDDLPTIIKATNIDENGKFSVDGLELNVNIYVSAFATNANGTDISTSISL